MSDKLDKAYVDWGSSGFGIFLQGLVSPCHTEESQLTQGEEEAF